MVRDVQAFIRVHVCVGAHVSMCMFRAALMCVCVCACVDAEAVRCCRRIWSCKLGVSATHLIHYFQSLKL